jgi:hypothetical protein
MTSLGERIAESAEKMVGSPFKLGGFCRETGIDCFGLWIRSAAEHLDLVRDAIPTLERCTLVRDEFNPMSRHFSDVVKNTSRDPAADTIKKLDKVIQEVDPGETQAGDLHIYEGGPGNPCAHFHGVVVCKDTNYLVQACKHGVVRIARRRMELKPKSAVRMVCP